MPASSGVAMIIRIRPSVRFDSVVEQQHRRGGRGAERGEVVAEAFADDMFTRGQIAFAEDVAAHAVEAEHRQSDLVAGIAEVIVGDRADCPAADDARFGTDHGGHALA